MNTLARTTPPTPWYREPWPWLLMAGPAIVVVAGFVTLGMAINSADGLVADDYYKEGNAINMTMHRDVRARELGYHARVAMAGEGGQISLAFSEAAPPVPKLKLMLNHPTRSGFDRAIVLTRQDDGRYAGIMPAVEAGRWSAILDDEGQAWRLTGDWQAGSRTLNLGSVE